MTKFSYHRKVKTAGQNLSEYLLPKDLNRKRDYTPTFYDLWAVSRFTDGRTKLEFTEKEFIREVAMIIKLTKITPSAKTCVIKAEIAFRWWKVRGAIVEV